MSAPRVRRWFLYALVASIGLSAALGSAVILIGQFRELEVKILLSSLTISGASLCGVCCGAALEAGRVRPAAAAGIALSLLSGCLVVGGLWGEAGSANYWKTTATFVIGAVAASHLSVLMLARLAPRYLWALWFAHGAILAVALILVAMLWLDLDEGPAFRWLGVAAVLDGAVTILIPILHRLSRSDLASSDDAIRPELADIDRQIAALQTQLRDLEAARQQLLAGAIR